ncbi:efflux transporter outer membrane subunit [Pseudomonas sp. FP1740]|uniref:efflux transporter outer membrane subunit n=1 Tax=Pseudomonas sp. FP1740 TaxID=2954078 RepID=UPI0027367CDA|nr:efflux transporter outer membrane subunit [Pseudomonas sp. FP1740]WLG47349.1 efflux transporter outer membrane subunit [Pseudomonas sp. FP1740]
MTSQRLLSQLRQCAIATLGAVSLAGCMVGPDFVKPENELGEMVLTPRQDHPSAPLTSDAAVPSQWWLLFNDAVLAELQSRAQADNLDLLIASERIEQSRAQLGIASSQLLPSVAANASYTREGLSEHGKFAALGAPTAPDNFWQLGFDASWELDLWGRAQRTREGAAATLEATVYDREAARVALSAEVARTYLQLRGTQAQLDIAQQNLRIAERTLGLAESRERNGVATRFETSSARAQLATIKALVPELTQRRNALMNALALLMGEQPRTLDAQLRQAMPLPSLPTRVPVGVPSELAHRRPDILRAEAQLHAATAAIGVAKADFYPRIGLKGKVGVEAFESSDLASWDSRFFSVGPTVYLPIFQGGRLTQRLALNESRQKTAALAYRQTVLRAWHEVDNALDAWAAQQRRHAELLDSYEQNKQALQSAERGYQQGATDYLSVLTAQLNVLASQTSLNDSATNATLTVVNLYKSLGGGWDPQAGIDHSTAPPSVALASPVAAPSKADQ